MQEIISKKAKPGKKVLEKDEVIIRKKSYNCDCGCAGSGSDYDGGFDSAFNDSDPACGCGCGSDVSANQSCDMAYED